MHKIYNIKNSNTPNNAIYIGRGTQWGNPFIIGTHGSRDMVCDRFEKEILPTLDITFLRGKDMVCHCKPKRCHGDSIVKKIMGQI